MNSKVKNMVIIIVSFFVGVSGTIAVYHYFPYETKNTTEVVEQTKNIVTIQESDTLYESVQKVYDATVLIEKYNRSGSLASIGSGFVYKKDENYAYIITNHHVIKDASSIRVTNTEGEEVTATLLGSDEYADIAVLRIDASAALLVAEIGDSSELRISDTVFAVGTPVSKQYMGTVTGGRISSRGYVTVSIELDDGTSYMMELLQTDAAINPGNSGGPLVNVNGQVIGVNSLKLVEEQIDNMGFAIPIEHVMSVVDRLEKGEKIVRPQLGVTLVDATSSYYLYKNQIYLEEDFESGVAITQVSKNSTAEKYGLQKGDVILAINGIEIDDIAHFRFILYKYTVGDEIIVQYYRNKKVNEIKITLDQAIDN